jgi:hypothetical protein
VTGFGQLPGPRVRLALALAAVVAAAAIVPGALAQQNLRGIDITVTAGERFTRPVAGFDHPSSEPPSAFRATIGWGDATPESAGEIVQVVCPPPVDRACYEVRGTHAYRTAGIRTLTITVSGPGAPDPVSVAATATVHEAARPPSPPRPAAPLPETTITGAVRGRVTARSATIAFSSDQVGARFECALDGAPFADCRSPVPLSNLSLGSHVFAVRALTAAGSDPTPATAEWTVIAGEAVPRLRTRAGKRRAVVPRATPEAVIDGRCGDRAYRRATRVRVGGRVALLVHSGRRLFACFPSLTTRVRRASVAVDPLSRPRGGGSRRVYEVSVDRDGRARARRGLRRGSLVATRLPASDLAGASVRQRRGWGGELSVALEWLGGYARSARARLALSPASSARWPSGSTIRRRAGWGRLRLAPVYGRSARSGSAFVDGRGGYLVVPYSRRLNPRAGTIAAWVRAVGGDCGTIVGNGRLRSYWLAACQVLEFAHLRGTLPLRGPRALGEGWHHVAVTVEPDGERRLFLDGRLESADLKSPPPRRLRSEREQDNGGAGRLGRTTLPFRIGSDRDADEPAKDLHGYVQDLMIWRRALSLRDVRRVARRGARRADRRTGLVGWWPFEGDLEDRVGGNHAGLVGSASLARARPRRRLLPLPRSPRPRVSRPARPGAWDARIPLTGARPAIDGECPPSEYGAAAFVRLEPSRGAALRLMLTEEALYLCSAPLFGLGRHDGLTVWIARDGSTRTAPSAHDLRVRLGADGSVRTAAGDGTGYRSAPLSGMESRVAHGRTWGFQDDMDEVRVPWFAGEWRIPLAVLAPLAPGAPLRLGVRYEGSLAKEGVRPLRPGARFLKPARRLPRAKQMSRGRWPAGLKDDRPPTLGTVTTSAMQASPQPALAIARDPFARRAVGGARAAAVPTARATAPTTAQFEAVCPYGEGDPGALPYAFDPLAKWPPVAGPTLVRSEGTLRTTEAGIHVSAEDSPAIHTSHDLDMKMTPTTESTKYTLNGESTQVLEVESREVPPQHSSLVQARPDRGDHVTALGLWIFDCGHAPKTELHPVFALESDRPAYYAFPDGVVRSLAEARVWFNAEPSPYWSTEGPMSLDFGTAYTQYTGGLGAFPFVRVLEGELSRVSPGAAPGTLRVTTPPLIGGSPVYFTRIAKGYAISPSTWDPPRSVVVHLDKLTVKDDHDGASKGDGEWYMAANLSGHWRQIWWDADAEEDETYTINKEYRAIGKGLQLQITAYEEDGLIDKGGEELASPIVDIDKPGPLTINNGDYKLTGTITEGPPAPPILTDMPFWTSRLAGEPDNFFPRTLTAPGGSGTVIVDAFVTEPGKDYDGGTVRLLEPDIDRYSYDAGDFVDVKAGPLPPALEPLTEGATLKRWFPDSWVWALSDCEKQLLGARGASVTVRSTSGNAGDVPYTLAVTGAPRQIPGDWGEPLEGGATTQTCTPTPIPKPGFAAGQRPVDLTLSATPKTKIVTRKLPTAWQHVAGDIDRYDIGYPPVATKRLGARGTECDDPPSMHVRAKGMAIQLGRPGIAHVTGKDEVSIDLPPFADRHVWATIAHPAGRRDVYRVEFTWSKGKFYTEVECAALKLKQKLHGMKLASKLPVHPLDPVSIKLNALLDPVVLDVDVFELGGFRALTPGARNLDAVVSSPGGEQVTARLYDRFGVLMTESIPLASPLAPGRAPIPHGHDPVGRLAARDLDPRATYVLQVVPPNDGALAGGFTSVGLSHPATG